MTCVQPFCGKHTNTYWPYPFPSTCETRSGVITSTMGNRLRPIKAIRLHNLLLPRCSLDGDIGEPLLVIRLLGLTLIDKDEKTLTRCGNNEILLA